MYHLINFLNREFMHGFLWIQTSVSLFIVYTVAFFLWIHFCPLVTSLKYRFMSWITPIFSESSILRPLSFRSTCQPWFINSQINCLLIRSFVYKFMNPLLHHLGNSFLINSLIHQFINSFFISLSIHHIMFIDSIIFRFC